MAGARTAGYGKLLLPPRQSRGVTHDDRFRTGGHLWASRFDRDLTDIFAVQDELTREIVAALKLKLTAGEQDRLAPRRSVNFEAYEFYLRGREQAWAANRAANVAARGLLDARPPLIRDMRPHIR